jgi:hypothetical protein
MIADSPLYIEKRLSLRKLKDISDASGIRCPNSADPPDVPARTSISRSFSVTVVTSPVIGIELGAVI